MAGQVQNGKAFEYALALQYYSKLQEMGINVELIENAALSVARGYFQGFSTAVQKKYNASAIATLDTMLKIEPGLTNPNTDKDVLKIMLSADGDGADGDVRDVVFKRDKPVWEIGFSAKNNNDAVKHSRLSSVLDFGKSWVGVQ